MFTWLNSMYYLRVMTTQPWQRPALITKLKNIRCYFVRVDIIHDGASFLNRLG